MMSAPEQNADWSQAHTAVRWIGCAMLAVGGLATAELAEGWQNEVVTGFVLMLSALIFFPPLLAELRKRVPGLRPVALVVLWLAIWPIAIGIGLPFTPTPARQAELKVAAVSDARVLLSKGKLTEARMRLSKYAGLTDPGVTSTLTAIATAEDAANKSKAALANRQSDSKPSPATMLPSPSPTPSDDQSEVDARASLTTMKALQDRMNDPTSLLVVGNKIEHVTDGNGKPVLKSYVKYRGSNAYGGTVTEAAVLTITPDGNTVIDMVDATSAL